jgi:hypothetical protein
MERVYLVALRVPSSSAASLLPCALAPHTTGCSLASPQFSKLRATTTDIFVPVIRIFCEFIAQRLSETEYAKLSH